MSDYCGTERCKELGCFGYCNYVKKQQIIYETSKRRKEIENCLALIDAASQCNYDFNCSSNLDWAERKLERLRKMEK